MKLTYALAASLLALSLTASPRTGAAQTTETPAKTTESAAKPTNYAAQMYADMARARVQTFYLTNASQEQEANEIVVALRNILPPYIKIYLVGDQNAIVIDAPPEQLALAQKLITELDRPRKSYRLTYTLTELDGKQRIGTEHFSMIVVTGQQTSLKQGSKVPVATGSYSPGSVTSNGTETQFTYLDVGMNFDATLDETEHGARLKSKVEESSLGEDKTISGVNEPVVRQTVLQGIAFLTLNKPLMLGSVDITGSTRHIDIEVVMEQVQ
jgi:type II secretory pathway component GspD/PulD (secretin)